MLEKLKEFSNKLNELGIPLPMLRDPKTGKSSVSLTMLFISFNTVLIGLVGKWSGALGGIDLSQALNLFMVSAGLYFSRKMTGSATDKTVVIEKEGENNDK